ncbi:uncharacterized protein YjiK [Caldalkalibacillus uzonensis]|uniref:Uncharacterized protein YjiK n=1 Tax=Caldalkalibacillus uzonensis TaxID=353224 RepID=A0ABU0CR00_9BACI|nr:hypothetical protein [Caldalkalibacillus uzonensis]MDQ0338493.1 uncharacterized protein YjiK [Caldalkalibacillus uzonensis]
MTSPLFVGIDVGSESNVVCCLTRDEEKRPLSRFSITNNRPGILELQERGSHQGESFPHDQLVSKVQ